MLIFKDINEKGYFATFLARDLSLDAVISLMLFLLQSYESVVALVALDYLELADYVVFPLILL